MPVTSPDNVAYPDTSWVGGIVSAFATLATSIQAVFNRLQASSYRWTDASALAAQTGMRIDDRGYQIDTDTSYRYNGVQWVAFSRTAAGRIRIVPTSATGTGVALASDGTVTFAASAAISINGIFSTAYHNYVLEIRYLESAATTYAVRLRVSAADNSTAVYDTTLAGSATSFSIKAAAAAAQRVFSTLSITAPADLEPTGLGAINRLHTPSTGAIAAAQIAGTFRSTTAFDGLSLILGANSTGTLTIYADV